MPSDEELLEEARGGDETAFTAQFRRRQGAVYRFALHMSGDAAVSEDVTQEVFLALLQGGGRFDASRGTLLSFLYGIARNLILRRVDKKPLEDADEMAAEEDVLEDLTRRETIQAVRTAVLSLPLQYREAVVLCDLEGASYEDAAAALACPVGTVRSRLSRGRALLALKLTAKVVRSMS